ncbi:hypothetical protein, partial [Sinorhizobium medicae]|uniref:hypothetical protein n=2 Tax=Sinorhizobium medicae TaxID=110321 RepID=UPI001AEC9392
MEFLIEELTDEDGKIAIELLLKRQKPGAGRDAPGCIVTDSLRGGELSAEPSGSERAHRFTSGMLRGAGIRATSACFEAVGSENLHATLHLLTTRHVDKLRFHRHVLMTCRRHRHFRLSFSVGKEASEPFRPDRPKRSASLPSKQNAETKIIRKACGRRVRPRQNSSSPELTSHLRSFISQTSSRYVQFGCSMVQEDVGRCRKGSV